MLAKAPSGPSSVAALIVLGVLLCHGPLQANDAVIRNHSHTDATENTASEGVVAMITAMVTPTDEERLQQSAPFAADTWTIDAFFLSTTNINDEPVDSFYGGGIGINYFLWDGVAVRAEFVGVGVDQANSGTGGGGFNLLGRWHFYQQEDWSLFVEGGAGLLQTGVSVPDGSRDADEDGTNFNFSLHAGVGATYHLWDRTHLVGAFRYMHVSNANIDGGDRNPGVDSVGGYIGLMLSF